MRNTGPRSRERTSLTDLAGDIKRLVPMADAAALYGFPPNRAGYICCPFHAEKTGSCKIYPEDGGWHCFGCGEGGSVIDFVMKLFDLNCQQACLRLHEDFNLGLSEKKIDQIAWDLPIRCKPPSTLRRGSTSWSSPTTFSAPGTDAVGTTASEEIGS